MADQRILYNEEMVGANHPTKADTLNRRGNVEHEQDGTHKTLPVLTVTKQKLTLATELTIAAGVITATQALHLVDTEADAASDDLDTINGGAAGQMLAIRAAHTDRTVVVKHNTGNILTDVANISLDSTSKYLFFIYDGTLSKWVLVGSGSGSVTKSADAILSGAPVILTLKGSDGIDYYVKGYPTKT